MLDAKTINVINRIMKECGYEESIDKTNIEMLDCLTLVDKNRQLISLFDKYDKDMLSDNEKKDIINFKNNISNIINHKDDIDNQKINMEK